MNYLDFFDIERKQFVNEFLFEGWAKPEKLDVGKKSIVNLSLDDIKSVPTKFKIYFTFSIKFNSAEIRTRFEKKGTTENPTNTQTQIQKSMTSKASDMVSIAPKVVDYAKFYKDLIFPLLSSNSIKNRITKYAQAGTFNLEDFMVLKVTYPLVNSKKTNDILLWKQFCLKDKKDYKASPITLPFGFAIEFSATNKLKMYSRTEIMELVKELVPEFENAILKDNKYMQYIKDGQNALKEDSLQGTHGMWSTKQGTKSPLAEPDTQKDKSDTKDKSTTQKKVTAPAGSLAYDKIVNSVAGTISAYLGDKRTPSQLQKKLSQTDDDGNKGIEGVNSLVANTKASMMKNTKTQPTTDISPAIMTKIFDKFGHIPGTNIKRYTDKDGNVRFTDDTEDAEKESENI